MALSVPLQYIAALLAVDHAQEAGRAVLFASTVGFDEFERNIPAVAAISGASITSLEQIVAIGRQALSIASPVVKEQHLVSRVLLRQFCVPNARGEAQLLAHSLQYGRARLTGPGGVAKRDHFVKIDSQETEHVWGQVEQDLSKTLAAIRTRRVLRDPHFVTLLKEAVALHFARSLDTLEMQETLMRQTLEQRRVAYLDDWEQMRELYFKKHHLYPPLASRATREEIADDLLEQTKQLSESGVLFRLRVVDLFEKARVMAGWMGLRIMSPRSGEFLVGDVPAIPINEDTGASGLLGGVALGDATMIVLPLSPTRLLALARGPDEFVRIPAGMVRELNRYQIAHAKTQVATRPGSGLTDLVLAVARPSPASYECWGSSVPDRRIRRPSAIDRNRGDGRVDRHEVNRCAFQQALCRIEKLADHRLAATPSSGPVHGRPVGQRNELGVARCKTGTEPTIAGLLHQSYAARLADGPRWVDRKDARHRITMSPRQEPLRQRPPRRRCGASCGTHRRCCRRGMHQRHDAAMTHREREEASDARR
jgi:hypothetical protein